MNIEQVKALFVTAGCIRLYAKLLAENDNSKNQIYFGPDFSALSLFPTQQITAEGNPQKPIYKGKLNFRWLSNNGMPSEAPGAQLILYPQYPEVRFSGFLKGSKNAPNHLLNKRLANRVLFMGVAEDGEISGYLAAGESELSCEFVARFTEPSFGVFTELMLPTTKAEDARTALLSELTRISELEWITSKRLSRDGAIMACNAPNCGGYTLEAELGITPNGRSEPDYLGYEVKQTAVPGFHRLTSGTITLMTPEPTGGIYTTEGPEFFVRQFGYSDKKGRGDRMNFGGLHRAGVRHQGTELTLSLLGFGNGKIANRDGCLALVGDAGQIAASWDFKSLMQHWTRKHAHAVYVPSMMRKDPLLEYCFSENVRLAEQPDFLRLLGAFESGVIYYDPGIKLEHASTANPKLKRRSQFRIRSADIPAIYGRVETVNVRTGNIVR